MINWFNKILNKNNKSTVITEFDQTSSNIKPKTTKKVEKKKLTPKESATRAGEPYVEIVKIDIDKNNPSYGSFELDWNEHFIKKLRSMGYPGETDETVVDLWFQSVCRNILMETYEQDAANRSSDNIRYINRKNIGNGKTEIS